MVELYGVNIKVFLSTEMVTEPGAPKPKGREMNVSKASTVGGSSGAW